MQSFVAGRCAWLLLATLLLCVVSVGGREVETTSEWSLWKAQAQQIIAQPDLPLRNLQITNGYYQIGHLLQELLNTTNQANWLTHATWASNSVGISIRDQTLNDMIKELWQEVLPQWVIDLIEVFPDVLDQIIRQILNHTSASLSGGNVYVFNEIGSAVIAFGETFWNVTDIKDAESLLTSYLSSHLNVTRQSVLIRAMQVYWQVRYNTSLTDEERTQMMLLGNILVGYQEQYHLQSYIANAFPGNISINITSTKHFFLDTNPIVTKLVLTFVTANEVLFMGNDVPPFEGNDFPSELQELTNSELIEVYSSYVEDINSLQNTGAQNWSSLQQRMRFIAPLFRSRHMDDYLWTCPPFTKAQVQQIISNVMPNQNQLCIATCCAAS
eukprot:TRINITY_DN4140_c0_g1_i1.p1 TRINITY_DN4140_c0_g1~~TRINITY_DN4140_c0_g1_i1.p1  ORF type:complete len:384 (+),score=65.77 TRINITY_DN4140_c0_g1_i1:137-1288(+)